MTAAPGDWWADENFWVASYPFMFGEKRFEEAEQEAEALVRLTGCESGSVLDLACGPGRLAVPLAKRGFTVVGVDASQFLISKAWMRASDLDVEIEWVKEDMRAFVRPDGFDLVICMFTSFGLFDDPADNRRVLENAYGSLKPRGVFVVDVMGKEILARIFEPTGAREIDGDGLVILRRRVTDDWSIMENEWILLKGNQARSFRLRHWIYAGSELRTMLAQVGFGDVRLYGSLSGTAYGPEAQRLVAVARKPE